MWYLLVCMVGNAQTLTCTVLHRYLWSLPSPLFFCWPDRLLKIVFQICNALTSIKINYSYIWASLVMSAGKESTCNAGDPSSIPGSRSSPVEGIGYPLQYSWASLVAQTVKNLPAMWETWV